MTIKSQESAQNFARRKTKWLRNFALALLILTAMAFFLLTSGSPIVAQSSPPDASSVELARPIVKSLRNAIAEKNGTTSIHLDQNELAALVTLGNHAQNIARIDAEFSNSALVVRVSKSIPFGRWINAEAHLEPSENAFPPFYLKVGMVRFPQWFSRWLLDAGADVARWRGIPLPETSRLINTLSFQDGRMTAMIAVPTQNEIMAGASKLGFTKVDSVAVARYYCDLVDKNIANPQDQLVFHLRRSFPAGEAVNADDARSRLVALAMFVADEQFSMLAGSAKDVASKCRQPHNDITLAGRADLAKHWAMSAALTALADSHFADSLGLWKELSDSLPNGSGFSFVDIAADRSGFRYGRALSDPERSGQLSAQLANVKESQLLPPILLGETEGIKRQQFEGQYESIDSKAFLQVIGIIDETLDRAGVP